jgi:predicted transcriptional regulator
MESQDHTAEIIDLAAQIVASYVANNSVMPTDLPDLIKSVHGALANLGSASVEEPAKRQEPAVSVKKSLNSDFLICLEDGKKFKSLKRHLRTTHNLSPEEYRAKWNLPPDYPMVAPAYSAARSELAKSMGLGQQRRKVEPVAKPPAKKRKTRA